MNKVDVTRDAKHAYERWSLEREGYFTNWPATGYARFVDVTTLGDPVRTYIPIFPSNAKSQRHR